MFFVIFYSVKTYSLFIIHYSFSYGTRLPSNHNFVPATSVTKNE